MEKLMVNKVLEKSWTNLMVDFITKLPLIAKKDVILVVYDRLSKITYFVAITEEIVEGLVRLFRDNMEVAQIVKKYNIRQKTTVCSGID